LLLFVHQQKQLHVLSQVAVIWGMMNIITSRCFIVILLYSPTKTSSFLVICSSTKTA
jgi:hypothetical protein